MAGSKILRFIHLRMKANLQKDPPPRLKTSVRQTGPFDTVPCLARARPSRPGSSLVKPVSDRDRRRATERDAAWEDAVSDWWWL